jgi:hypothetical protein
VKRHRGGLGLAVIAAAVVLPVVVSAYRRRAGDYTRLPEFRAIVGDYLM